MKISKLTVKNFRSIGPEGITLNFDTNLTALIGRNNAGKSNILKAMDLIIGNGWPGENDFELEDFYQKNIQNDIEICIFFETPIEHTITIENWYEHKTKIYGFKLEYKTYKRDTAEAKAGELHLGYYCINSKSEIIRTPSKAPKRGQPREEFLKSFTNILRVSKKIREDVTGYQISVDRNILKLSPSNSRSVLGILLKRVREQFLNATDEIQIESKIAELLELPEKTSRKQLFEKYMEKANETLKTDELNTIASTIEKYLIQHVGKHIAEDVKFDFQIQDSWTQYKYISLAMKDSGLSLPADRLGHGFQSLIVIAVFRAYLELNEREAIFLIEAPEMFLHTHAKKYFYSILKQISVSGTQIIYSTHATEFLDLTRYKDVKRVVISDKSTAVFPKEAVDVDFNQDELLKLNSAINNERAELFFAEKVILVEGETEKLVYDWLLRAIGVDPNLFNISIIETSGKGSIPRYIKLLQSLSIPFIVIFDSDILEKTGDKDKDAKIEENNKDAKDKNKKIKDATDKSEALFMLEPYFEVAAGIKSEKTKKRESKPVAAMEFFQQYKSVEDIKSKMPEIIKPLDFLLNANTKKSEPKK